MNETNRAAAIAHAKIAFPREACGLIIVENGRERYVECRNVAEGDDHFIISAEDYAACEDRGTIVGIFHSHPNAAPDPSQADLTSCENFGVPWYIVGIPTERWAEFKPSGYRAPLVGREFAHGVLDCYAIIRDGFREYVGIEIPDYDRTDGWWDRGQNLYMENFESAGFVRVSDGPKKYDVLLMQVQSPVPNHAALYLGDDVILHHLHGRLSSRDVWGGYWRKHCVAIVRHQSLCAT